MSLESCFKGKTVLVTGAGRGIGRAVTAALHSAGAKVYALSRTEASLAALTTDFPGVIPVRADLSSWDETRAAVEALETMDVLINNGGVFESSPVLDITPEMFDRILNVNLKGVLNVSQVVAKKMIADKRRGAIVNVSSVDGIQAYAKDGAYCCSKAGLEMLAKVMAIELGPHGITVNNVNPGLVDTDMGWALIKEEAARQGKTEEEVIEQDLKEAVLARTPTQKIWMPMNDVVQAILFLASGLTSQITGSNLGVDGGYLVA